MTASSPKSSPKRGDYDQHIGTCHFPPAAPKRRRGGGTPIFDFADYQDVVRLASDLMARGFVWDEAYQASVDQGFGCNHLPTLKAAFQDPPAASAAPATPATPPPSHKP